MILRDSDKCSTQGGKMMKNSKSTVLSVVTPRAAGLKIFVKLLALWLLLLVLIVCHSEAAVFCVSSTSELNSALATAQSNGVDDTIRLVQGTYNGSFLYAANHSITIEGGYTAGCGSRIIDPANTILDGGATGQPLRLYSEVPVSFFVDGITVRNGRAVSTTDPSTMNGGGTWVVAGNTTPGGNFTMTNCVVSSNQAYQDGGGVYVLKADTVTLKGNTIQANSSGFGGGVYALEAKKVTLESNVITGNSVNFPQSQGDGGGVYVDTTFPLTGESGKNTTLVLNNNTLDSNTAVNNGGGIFIYCSPTGDPRVTLSGNTLTGNGAKFGGGLGISYGLSLTIAENTVKNNTASVQGGGLFVYSTQTATVVNNVIHDNTSAQDGGGLYVLGLKRVTVTNNTFTRNGATSSFGGGIWIGVEGDSDVAEIYNNIVYANTSASGAADIAIDNDRNGNNVYSPVSLVRNDFNRAVSGFFITQPDFAIPAGNLNNVNPGFVGADDLRLQTGSSCIGAGDNNAPGLRPGDRAGNYRFSGPTIDMGAYQRGALPLRKRRIVDFDGDGQTDLTVYHKSSGLWFIRESSTDSVVSSAFGGPDYTPAPGDYDGDGKMDIAVYHEASGLWFIRSSSTGTTAIQGWGGPGYAPVPQDYDGDGKTDLAVYHASSGLWFAKRSSDGTTFILGYGGPDYTPVPEDYDGDGIADVAVYHSPSGLWFMRYSTTGSTVTIGFGGLGYTPVPRDYDGDGIADVAVYHPSSGLWFVRRSTTGTMLTLGYGGTAYSPVSGFYDGDGRSDIAVYHESSGLWFLRESSTDSTVTVGFGGTGYTPVN